MADWPILNAGVCGQWRKLGKLSSWWRRNGYSMHAGQVIVADGTDEAARRIERTLTCDPAMGVLRHVDAGYDRAVQIAHERKVRIPGVTE